MALHALALKGISPLEKDKFMESENNLGIHAGAKPEIFRFAEKLRANMTEEEKKRWEL